jgi:hypothetical protein
MKSLRGCPSRSQHIRVISGDEKDTDGARFARGGDDSFAFDFFAGDDGLVSLFFLLFFPLTSAVSIQKH